MEIWTWWKLLLDQGARLDQVTFRSMTTLHAAIWSRNLELVHYLIAKGVDGRVEDAEGRTAAQETASVGLLKPFKLLVQKFGTRATASWDGVAFELCEYETNDAEKAGEIMACLIDQGLITVQCRDQEDSTLLHRAIANRAEEIVKVLLERNANPLVRDRNGRMACQLGWSWWPTNVIRRLAEKFGSDCAGVSFLHVDSERVKRKDWLQAPRVCNPDFDMFEGEAKTVSWWIHLDTNDVGFSLSIPLHAR